MSMLARYKKNSASLMELVKLIEESAEPKKSNLLNMVLREDPEFGERVKRRLFDYDRLKTLDEGLIAEIIASTPPKIIALALFRESNEDFVKLVEKCAASRYAALREEKETFVTAPPNDGQVDSARRKIVSEARKLESDGAIKLMDYDKLDSGADLAGSSAGTESLGDHQASGADGTPTGNATGNATEESGIPAVASFGMEVPPVGLMGERFENYVKKTLGLK